MHFRYRQSLTLVVSVYDNKKPRYRKDDRAMRPIYECPENRVYAQNQPTIAQESPHYNLISIRW